MAIGFTLSRLTYPGNMADATGETGEQLLGGLAMRRKEREPTYLQIYWDETQPDGSVVPFEAFLCLPHRREGFVEHPSARGSGRLGAGCDLCEGREPRRGPAPSAHGTTGGPAPRISFPVPPSRNKEAVR
jgi:hypothetical protein